jgi:hypothetical protein
MSVDKQSISLHKQQKTSEESKMNNYADANPTKEFFINMLTRDIELSDAILDLLDNCLDGVVRLKKDTDKKADKRYYENFKAEITITKNSFIIKDNCGGISRTIAEKYAFRMGREETGEALPTVGMYGIGMKRAIFKIGKEAEVISLHADSSFSVKIPENWAVEQEWKFPITDITKKVSTNKGTEIKITKLTEGVAKQWGNDSLLGSFINDLKIKIRSSYSLIIEKGFNIFVNGKKIEPFPVQLLISKEKKKNAIKPFIFEKQYGDVNVYLTVGFYAPPPTDDELDEAAESKRSSSDAGWTVVCNDRVVVYNNKDHLTGWGEAGVPQYHTQFIGIRGIVIFESNIPGKLPMTTTKRGIDLSSPIYADIKNKMREGIKFFISYTNQWKGRNEEERIHSKATDKVSYPLLFESKDLEKRGIRLQKKDGGLIFRPDLPKPPNDKEYAIIRFSRSKDDIEIVRNFFYSDRSIEVKPSKVGENCFDFVLKKKAGGR